MFHLFPTRFAFFLEMLGRRIQRQPCRCPFCGATSVERIGRKKILLDVLRCKRCLLVFRYPLETPERASRYYQRAYRSGAVTSLPDDTTLRALLNQRFVGTPLDLWDKICVVQAVKPHGVVVDYGCSWGYGTWQLQNAGYDVIGFEISKHRAAFGRRKLGVRIVDEPQALHGLRQAVDVIFTNHVLEHLSDLAPTLEQFSNLLREDGVMISFLPNFTGPAARSGGFWHWIGRDHPIAPTADFFRHNLPAHGFPAVVVASGPFEGPLVEKVRTRDWAELDTEGDELMILAWKRA